MIDYERKAKFAVIGCGAISKSHFVGIADTEEAELVAVCDVNIEQAEVAAKQYGVRAYSDYEQLLSQSDIDVVSICTPSSLHHEQTILAARAGKHVICEKPLAIKLEHALEMVDECERQGVRLATVFPRRMSPAARYAKRLIDEGRLGQLSLCSGHAKFYRDQAYYDSAGWRGTWAWDGGGSMMNQGIHTVDMLQWLAGPVESLYGYSHNVLRSIEVEDTSVTALKFASGALGMLETTTTAHNQPDHQIVIQGDLGTLVLTGNELTKLDIRGGGEQLPAFVPPAKRIGGHTQQIQDMARAILEDREPIITGRDGVHSLAIILGTYESQRSHREVQLTV